MVSDLVGHGISCQGKDYEIIGVTGGDVYSAGGQSVFDVFGTSAYTFLEVERGGIAGNMIVATYTATGIFKLRSDMVRGDNTETKESNATLHIRPTESFLSNVPANREHYTATLQETNFSDYEVTS